MWIWSSSNCWISYCNHNYGKKTKDTNHIRKFPINESKEQKEIFLLLQKDDIDGFISFLSKNPTIDITEEQEVDDNGYYYCLFDLSRYVLLIDFCCFFGSLKCFKYLLLNQCEITEKTLKYSIAGGNQ